MNLVDCTVTKVLSDPTYHTVEGVSWWAVEVEYDSWGTITTGRLTADTFEQAYAVAEGYKFLA